MNEADEPGSHRAADHSTLAERLRARIKQTGPITFRDWMAAALYDPAGGYYRRDDIQRWGREGDYRTSPERSPLFAATFARYFAGLYETLDRPARWTIVELGAGAGHFAEGVLRTLRLRFPEVFAATAYVIDEVSESSNAVAKERLAEFSERVEFRPLNRIEKIETGVVFSNELLDAFPVHRVTMRDGQLNELCVTVGPAGDFQWICEPPSTPRLAEYLNFVGAQISEGQIAEINLEVEGWLTNVTSRLLNGYVVTVDYGAEASELYGTAGHEHGPLAGREQGTLRAFRRHQFVDDVLAQPGEQDLTTTIDWSFVKKFGEQLGLATVEFERQDRFLLQAGLLEELEALATEAADEAGGVKLRAASRELILPIGMAASFQVLVQRT